MHGLEIKQYRSSAYHPESRKISSDLENMLRSYCFDTEKNWDEGIHILLFAVQKSVQESLGSSPFELVLGHTVRGTLNLFKREISVSGRYSNELTSIGLVGCCDG